MNFFILRILIILFCLPAGLAGCKNSPDAYDTRGNPVYFSSLRGQYVVINYFAAWCKPCWNEMPVLNTFARQYAGKVTVLGVNYDHHENSQLTSLITQMGIEFPVLKNDPGKKFGIIHIEGLPMTVIINPAGKKHTILMGEQTLNSLRQATGLS
jgi:thiol-disulfide isomerase/thioredoxin